MTTPFTSLTHLLRSQIEPYERVAWFVFESLEREHRLTLTALSASSPTTGFGWVRTMQPLAHLFPAAALMFANNAFPVAPKRTVENRSERQL